MHAQEIVRFNVSVQILSMEGLPTKYKQVLRLPCKHGDVKMCRWDMSGICALSREDTDLDPSVYL